MAQKKKHHYVSAHILRNFADSSGVLQVCPIRGGPKRLSTATNLGFRNHAHTVTLLDRSNGAVFEDLQADLEGQAAAVVSKLQRSASSRLDENQIEIMQRFLVLHMFRHPQMMQSIRESVDIDVGPLEGTRQAVELQQDLLAHAVSWAAYVGDPTHDLASGSERWTQYRDAFVPFEWNILRFDHPSLVVGDTLVCTSAILATERDPSPDRSYGVGLQFAESHCATDASPGIALVA